MITRAIVVDKAEPRRRRHILKPVHPNIFVVLSEIRFKPEQAEGVVSFSKNHLSCHQLHAVVRQDMPRAGAGMNPDRNAASNVSAIKR